MLSALGLFLLQLGVALATKEVYSIEVPPLASGEVSQHFMFPPHSALGSMSPSISVNSESPVYVAVFGPEDTVQLNRTSVEAFCPNPANKTWSQAVSFEIQSKGVHTVQYLSCSNETVQASVVVTALNPYGHLPGELFMLLPVRFM